MNIASFIYKTVDSEFLCRLDCLFRIIYEDHFLWLQPRLSYQCLEKSLLGFIKVVIIRIYLQVKKFSKAIFFIEVLDSAFYIARKNYEFVLAMKFYEKIENSFIKNIAVIPCLFYDKGVVP